MKIKSLKLSIFLGILLLALFGNFNFALAAPGDVSGWAWSSTIGWISFAGDNNPPSGGGNYRVRIESDNNLSGYAWSSNIGWISFNDNGCPPGLPTPPDGCRPKLVGDRVVGFAKALAAEQAGSGGWTGWINLGGGNGGNLTISPSATRLGFSDFNGWAWGGGGTDPTLRNQIIGWTSFNGNNPGAGGGDYKVTVELDVLCPDGVTPPPCPGGNPPDDVVIESGAQNYCDPAAGFGEFVYRINARPSGGNGEVSVEHNLSPNNAVNESPSRVNLPGNFEILLGFDSSGWDTEYRYFTEVGDVTSNDIVFRTPHQRPGLEYTIVDRPDLGDNFFEFEATGSCDDPAGCIYEWRFDGGSPPVASGPGPHEVEFSSRSVAGVLTVTNRGDGYSCPVPFGGSGTILPLPQWREVSPFNNR